MDALNASMSISGAGLEAQSNRLRIVSENLANANTTGTKPGEDPYQRKTISFATVLDRVAGAQTVYVKEIGVDQAEFKLEFNPGHVAADDKGMVKLPNVNSLIEMSDMREAVQSYEANVQALKQARSLIQMTIDMMRS